MASQKRVNGSTPNGGVYSIAYFLNDDNESVDESQATKVEVVEFSPTGEQIARTYASVKKEE